MCLAMKSQALPTAKAPSLWLSSLAGKCLVPPLHQDIILLRFTGTVCHMVCLQAPATLQALGTIFAASAITGDCMSYDFLATADQPAGAAMAHSRVDLHVGVDISSTLT